MAIQFVHVIINPAAGRDLPILHTMNRVFQEADMAWDASITHKAGDAYEQTQRAIDRGADVVAAYGGDGTVAEVARGLIDHPVPLAILPGGTANVMSYELGIPADLEQACRIACGLQSSVRLIDTGRVNEHPFVLRVGVGFEAQMVHSADRNQKDRFGSLAYLWSALQNLQQPQSSRYHLTLDECEVDTEGITCIIANSGNLGRSDLKLIPSISVSDELLDVILIQEANWRSLFDMLGAILSITPVQAKSGSGELTDLHQQVRQSLQYWQTRSVNLVAEPSQSVQYDGEMLGTTPIYCEIRPQSLRVLVPEAENI